MTPAPHETRKIRLVEQLISLPAETDRVEFKTSNSSPMVIGKLISALSNSARLASLEAAYVVWGVRDADHAAVGTNFKPSFQKKDGQPLEFWLSKRLNPDLDFRFDTLDIDGVRLVLLTVPAAYSSPVRFDSTAYIRIGSATPRLSEHPQREKNLWTALQPYTWETIPAATSLTEHEVLERLDYLSYFLMNRQNPPSDQAEILEKLSTDRIIQPDTGGQWNITNLGAILFARNLNDFPISLARKGLRFASYEGAGRATTATRGRDERRGYISGFPGMLDHIGTLLPENEHIEAAIRKVKPLYPEIAIRELIANALIHQDMTITGAGPLVELFSDRLEITNPGKPLVPTDRFLDSAPRSRNEALSSMMRRAGIREERGTGIDKVLHEIEYHQLPPPEFRAESEAVRVILHAPRSFAKMTRTERVRACYQHAALMYVNNGHKYMRNITLCKRFGIEKRNAAQASAVIKQAMEAELIRPVDVKRPRAGYVPFWA